MIKSANIVMENSGGNEVYQNTYTTNNNGIVDLLGVSDGSYSMNYIITDYKRSGNQCIRCFCSFRYIFWT